MKKKYKYIIKKNYPTKCCDDGVWVLVRQEISGNLAVRCSCCEVIAVSPECVKDLKLLSSSNELEKWNSVRTLEAISGTIWEKWDMEMVEW